MADQFENELPVVDTIEHVRGVTSGGDSVRAKLGALVRKVVLTGLDTSTNSAISALDSVLSALGKLQAQITGLENNKLGDSDLAANGGTVPETNRQNIFTGQMIVDTGVLNNALQLKSNDPGCYLTLEDGTTASAGQVRLQCVGNALQFYSGGVQQGAFVGGGGFLVGSPSGSVSAGEINAEAVKDDGSLLTDYVQDAYIDGFIDTEAYDNTVPNREIVEQEAEPEREVEEPVTRVETVLEEQWSEQRRAYVRRPVQKEVPVYDEYSVLDEDDNEVGRRRVQRTRTKTVPAKERIARTEVRTHEPARQFDMNELDPGQFASAWSASRKLPAVDRLEQRMSAAGKSKAGLGETIQALIETCEVQAVHIEKLRERIESLESGGPRNSV